MHVPSPICMAFLFLKHLACLPQASSQISLLSTLPFLLPTRGGPSQVRQGQGKEGREDRTGLGAAWRQEQATPWCDGMAGHGQHLAFPGPRKEEGLFLTVRLASNPSSHASTYLSLVVVVSASWSRQNFHSCLLHLPDSGKTHVHLGRRVGLTCLHASQGDYTTCTLLSLFLALHLKNLGRRSSLPTV